MSDILECLPAGDRALLPSYTPTPHTLPIYIAEVPLWPPICGASMNTTHVKGWHPDAQQFSPVVHLHLVCTRHTVVEHYCSEGGDRKAMAPWKTTVFLQLRNAYRAERIGAKPTCLPTHGTVDGVSRRPRNFGQTSLFGVFFLPVRSVRATFFLADPVLLL